jgi:nitrite reductase/ring-hydroxylating ferredoxin subunit
MSIHGKIDGVGLSEKAGEMAGHIRVGPLDALKQRGCTVVSGQGHTIAVFYHEGQVYAVDNRCPHMGFPLDRGTVKDGILTCHWHHARFDLSSGGTLDPFADDVRAFPVSIVDGEVWVNPSPPARDPVQHWSTRLREGAERTSLNGADISAEVLQCMNVQQQVEEVAQLVSRYLSSSAEPGGLLATLGQAMLREDAGFHAFQLVDAAFGQFQARRGTEAGRHVLIGLARYLAAHAPTPRAIGQTYQIALRLHRGEELYEAVS